MSIFRVIGILVLLVGPLGCFQSDSEKQQENPPSIAEIEGTGEDSRAQAPLGVVPIELSEKDQANVQRAPEGMAFVKGGCFTMGNDRAQADEKYEHEVCLDDFYLDRYEVTQARWTPVMGFNPSKMIHEDRPVEQVNYHDIQQFIDKSGGACRLPTEAEWEYAARGQAKT